MREILEWKYQARRAQVQAIFTNADYLTNQEMGLNADNMEILSSLLLCPPIMVPELIKQSGLGEENFYQRAGIATKLTAKRVRVLEILLMLVDACDPKTRFSREIPIDRIDLTVPAQLRLAFKNTPELLDRVVELGREEAAISCLKFVEGQTPLMRYRRDISQGRFEFTPTLDGGITGFAPTRIEAVCLKFWYPGQERMPKLALRVSELL